jgi:hypothetical protein
MSTVKISQLPVFTTINANTANTLFVGVDIPTDTTFQLTAKTLAAGLYSNSPLAVGNNLILFPNTVAQFSGSVSGYMQVNQQNFNANGTADYILTADTGNDVSGYFDLGINNSGWNRVAVQQTAQYPLDGYLIVQGTNTIPGNLVIGTAQTGSNISFQIAGYQANNVVAVLTANGLVMNTSTYIQFADGTQQSTAAVSNSYIQAGFTTANTALANTVYLQGVINTQNTNIQLAQNTANTAVQNTSIIQLQTLRLTGNLVANSTGQGIFVDKFTSNSATFSQNLVVLGNLTSNTLLGNIFFSNVITTTTQSNSILWNTQTGSVPQQTAQLWYYSNTQSLILDTDIPGDRLSISKVLFFRGYNSTGATIPANSFIRLISGVTTNNIPYIALADATSSANATVAGFVKNAISNGAFGFAYSQGIVEDINSTGLGQNGDILFLSTTPGLSSNTAPVSSSSNTVVQLGRVILSDANQGKLFIQNQLRQAYGRPNGSVLYAFANNITSSNTISINDSTGTVNANTIIANTVAFGSATANAMVTQLTSKSTAVTANGISGQITMNGAALAGQAYANFTVNNSYVQHVNDIVIVNVQNGVTTPNPYIVSVGKVAVGSFNITILNADSGGGSSHSDAVVLNWALIRVGN